MSETLSVRVPDGTKEKLDQIGRLTRRTRSFLAAEAITAYAEEQLAIIEGIGKGLEDVAAGRVVTHEEAMARLRKTVAAHEKE